MTMIDNHAPAWHTTTTDARDTEIADLRRRLADAEHRAMTAASREDFAQFAFETAQRRADRAETILRAVAAVMDDGLTARLDEDARTLLQDWTEEHDFGPDGFTPANATEPF